MVFDSLEDLPRAVDDPDLDVKADDILVLRNAGPKGAPGMPEAGYLPIPMKLARAGVKDMVRISDARMSGTAFGTIVLHITPGSGRSAGRSALVQTGDRITLDVPKPRRSSCWWTTPELAPRKKAWTPPPAAPGQRPRLPQALHRRGDRRRPGLRLRLLPAAGDALGRTEAGAAGASKRPQRHENTK